MNLLPALLLGLYSFAPVVSHKNCLSPEEVYQKVAPSVVKINVDDGHGSGVVIDKEGTVLTATHVIAKMKHIQVEDEGQAYPYKVHHKGTAPSVTTLEPKEGWPYSYTELTHTELVPGEPLYAIGFPIDYPKMFTSGIYMGERIEGGVKYLISTTSVSPGNSGGPVVDCEGNIAGFVYAIDRRAENIYISNPVQDAYDILD